MTDHIQAWLDPMLQAAADQSIETLPLLRESAGQPSGNPAFLPRGDLYSVRNDSVDWLRFGQLLRERLGWHHYPSEPSNLN